MVARGQHEPRTSAASRPFSARNGQGGVHALLVLLLLTFLYTIYYTFTEIEFPDGLRYYLHVCIILILGNIFYKSNDILIKEIYIVYFIGLLYKVRGEIR